MVKRFTAVLIIAIVASACSAPAGGQAATQTQAPATPTAEQTLVGEPSETPSGEAGATMDYATFISALKANGWPVDETGKTFGSLFTGDGHIIHINPGQPPGVNGVEVQIFEYADHAALEAQAALISKDGSKVSGPSGEAIVEWADMPHFFKSGRILAVYIGRDDAVLSTLKGQLGDEFAGGTIEAWGPGPQTPIPPGDSNGLPPAPSPSS
jgi:hypothetical protein